MAHLGLAKAVLEHANQYYNVDNWYVIADCWDELSIAEELDQQEEKNGANFNIEAAAIAYFDAMINPNGRRRTHH